MKKNSEEKTTKTLSIKGSELKSALDRIVFDDDVFEFEVDYFWEIDDEEIYDCPYTNPKTFGLGQITEEWEMLQEFLQDKDYYPINRDLRKLGLLLKAIGDTVDQSVTSKGREE